MTLAQPYADLLRDLAQAEQALGKFDKAQAHFAEAYRLEPYNAMNAVKIADCIVRRSGRAEALRFCGSSVNPPVLNRLNTKISMGISI